MTEFIGGAHQSDTHQKALRINLDPRWYGTIAEIGAGQEVVRWFFRVGGAAGTVAKSISAYDMAVSDAVYGKADRYVSVGRLQGMLDKEFQLNVERLGRRARRRELLLRLRRHGGGAQLPGRQRVPRLDGREVPGPAARRAEPDRHARPDARRGGLAAAGGPRHRRRQPAVRGVLPAPRAGEADREPARRPDRRPDRDRHDRVPRHRVPRRGQPADGAQARAARAERRGDVRPRPRGAAAQRGAAQEGDPGRAGQLPAADAREHRHARDGQGQVRARPGRGGQAGPAAHRDHHAEPARRRAARSTGGTSWPAPSCSPRAARRC